MTKSFLYKILFLGLLFIAPNISFAFFESQTNNLVAQVSPENPEASQQVNITLNSYLYNLDTCYFSWSEDNQKSTTKIGQKSFSLTMPPLGKSAAVSVSVSCLNQGTSLNKDFIFQANDVDFLISADTYIPPFYKGMAYPSHGSNIRIIAMPSVYDNQGNLIDSSNLIYSWSKKDKAMNNSSGFGKNSVTIKADDVASSVSMGLEIKSLSGESKVKKTFEVQINSPKLLLYENKPLTGIQYQKNLSGDFNLSQDEFNLVAEPFFFSNQSLTDSKVNFTWTMNGKDISNNNERSVTLRQNTGSTGQTLVQVNANDSDNFMSNITKGLNIIFGQKSGLFGL
jgi:hypothetical protein